MDPSRELRETRSAIVKPNMHDTDPNQAHQRHSNKHSTEFLWIGCLTGVNLDPKIQIKYIDTQNQLADILTKAKFHTWWVEPSFVFIQH